MNRFVEVQTLCVDKNKTELDPDSLSMVEPEVWLKSKVRIDLISFYKDNNDGTIAILIDGFDLVISGITYDELDQKITDYFSMGDAL